MAKKYTEKESIANKEIASVIKHFFVEYKNTLPDATHYKKNHNVLKSLMFPAPDQRSYTAEEIYKALKVIQDNKIVMLSLAILSWPDLLRACVDDDERALKFIVKNIKDKQLKDGLLDDKLYEVPKGW